MQFGSLVLGVLCAMLLFWGYSVMSAVETIFFRKEENQKIIGKFIFALESMPEVEPPMLNMVSPLKIISKAFVSNSGIFDCYCSVNIGWIGQSFIDALSEFSGVNISKKSDMLASIFTMAYRFLCELDLSNPGGLGIDFRLIKRFVEDNLEKFANEERSQLVYANYIMPANIIKELMHSSALSEIKSFSENAKTASKLKEKWDEDIKAKKAEINEIKEGLERIKTSYNFVGLVKGFESLASSKHAERKRSFLTLLALGFLMIAPILLELNFIVKNISSIDLHKSTLIYALPPIVALEMILLYIFRVVLFHFRSVSAQLLQINLRVSLCQFIQSYAEYSMKIKKQDPSALGKFESLIFSGIISDGDALPSTFDGVEQIAKLVNSVRGGK